MAFYAGIGSRKTPVEILDAMQEIALLLGEQGYSLRSGHADGADQAFEKGAECYDAKIFLPWTSFNKTTPISKKHTTSLPTVEAVKTVYKYHPNPKALSSGARLLHARNAQIVLGSKLNQNAQFIVCWTKKGLGGGGTGQALRIARDHAIPVYDLGAPGMLDVFASTHL